MNERKQNDTVEKWKKTFSLLLNDRKELLCIADKNGYFKEINSAWTDLLGYDEKTLTTSPFISFVHPDDVEQTIEEFRSLADDKAPTLLFTNRYRTSSGDYKYLCWSAFPVGDFVYSIARDITELKNMQKSLEDKNKELLQSEAKLRKITNALPVFVFQIDGDGKIAFYNSTCSELFFNKESVGFYFKDAFSEEMRNIIQECLNNFENNIEKQEYEFSFKRNHKKIILQGVAELFHSETNRLQGYIFTGWDITKQRKQEEEQIRLTSEAKAAQEASRLKSEFLAYMSHELRTPLVGIMGFSDLLFGTLPLNEDQKKMSERMQHCCQLLLSIISDILDLSKIEANKLEFNYEPFNLVQCIQNNVDIYSAKALDKNIELMSYSSPDLPSWIIGDQLRLDQVIGNVLSNAIKFTKSGTVTIKCDYVDHSSYKKGKCAVTEKCCDPTLYPNFSNSRPVEIAFTVQDTGIGINDAAIERIFQPFTQADCSTTRVFGGTGLGLTICKRLLEMMNGNIECESQLGIGTKFKFNISTFGTFSKEAIPFSNDDGPFPNLPNRRVLIVDNNTQSTEVFMKYFTKWKFFPCSVCYDCPQLRKFASDSIVIILILHSKKNQEKATLSLSTFVNRTILCTNLNFDTNDELAMFPFKIRCHFSSKELEFVLQMLLKKDKHLPHVPKASEAVPNLLSRIDSIRKVVQTNSRPVEVLVVDDNMINRELICAILKKMEISYSYATNGREAVDMVRSKGPDFPFSVIFMDIQMPELDGYEATQEIRKWEKGGGLHTPIVALTASAMKEDEERCKSAGMDGFMAKPYTLNTLCFTIYHWLFLRRDDEIKEGLAGI